MAMLQQFSNGHLVDMLMYHTAFPFSDAWTGGAYDPVPYWISGCWHEVAPITMQRFAGFANQRPSYISRRVWQTEVKEEKSSSTTFVTHAHAAYRLLNDQPIFPDPPLRQNDCAHYSVRGRVYPPEHAKFYDVSKTVPVISSVGQAPYYVSPLIDPFIERHNFALYDRWGKSGHSWGLGISPTPDYMKFHSLLTVFRYLKKTVTLTGNIGGQPIHTVINNVDYDLDPSGNFSLEYDITFTWAIFVCAYRHKIYYRHGLNRQSEAGLPWVAVGQYAKPGFAGSMRLQSVMTNLVWPVAGPPVPSTRDWYRTEQVGVHTYFTANSNAYKHTHHLQEFGVPRYVRRHQFPHEVLRIARSGMTLAADDAIAQVVPESGLFESLAEAKDLVNLLNGSEFLTILKEASQMTGIPLTLSTPWKVVVACISLWSTLTLFNNFSLKPSIDLLLKTDLSVGRGLSTLNHIITGKPVYGRAETTVDWEGETFRMVARCAMRFNMKHCVASPFLLEYNRWGLTPASFWQTFPFAFAVDWFTGIGDSIVRQQNVALAYALGLAWTSATVTTTTPIVGVTEYDVRGEHRFYERSNGSGIPSYYGHLQDWHRSPKWLGTPLAFALKLAGI